MFCIFFWFIFSLYVTANFINKSFFDNIDFFIFGQSGHFIFEKNTTFSENEIDVILSKTQDFNISNIIKNYNLSSVYKNEKIIISFRDNFNDLCYNQGIELQTVIDTAFIKVLVNENLYNVLSEKTLSLPVLFQDIEHIKFKVLDKFPTGILDEVAFGADYIILAPMEYLKNFPQKNQFLTNRIDLKFYTPHIVLFEQYLDKIENIFEWSLNSDINFYNVIDIPDLNNWIKLFFAIQNLLYWLLLCFFVMFIVIFLIIIWNSIENLTKKFVFLKLFGLKDFNLFLVIEFIFIIFTIIIIIPSLLMTKFFVYLFDNIIFPWHFYDSGLNLFRIYTYDSFLLYSSIVVFFISAIIAPIYFFYKSKTMPFKNLL